MKTEISKQFKWGFILSEQELRRIINTCIDNANKISSGTLTCEIETQLQDGSIIKTQSVDDIFGFENIGAKAIEKLNIEIKSTASNSWGIVVRFQNGYKNKKTWVSAEYEVHGESRDWVFVCSSDIGERIKRCRTLSFDHITSQSWFLMVPLFFGLLLSTSITKYIGPTKDIADKLQTAYDTGIVKNAIEAMIFIERTKSNYSFMNDTFPILIAFISPILAFIMLGAVLPKLYPSYSFYWGDYIPYFDKKRNFVKILWTVVILGVFASVVAGIILRYI